LTEVPNEFGAPSEKNTITRRLDQLLLAVGMSLSCLRAAYMPSGEAVEPVKL
jgi:hypothetical protein